MSYCRFENTYKDLLECFKYFDDDLSKTEHEYRKKMLHLCDEICCNLEDDFINSDYEED